MEALNRSAYVKDFIANGKLTAIRVVDCHTHMDGVYGTSMPISDIDGCMRLMEEENVGSIWCAPHGDLFYPLTPNADIENYMAKYPGRVRGYFSYNPNYGELYGKNLQHVLELPGYIGLKLLPEYHRYALDGEAYREMLEFADRHSLVVLVHTWGGSAYNSPAQVQNVIKKYRNLQMIMGHSAPGECEAAINLAAKYDNVYLDLCDIHRNNGMIERMVERAGSTRILFGTDMPWYDPVYAIGSVIFSHITDTDRENILFRNAETILTKIRKQG